MKQRIFGALTLAVVVLLAATSCNIHFSKSPSPTPTITVTPSPTSTRPAFTPPTRTPAASPSPTPTVTTAISTTSLPAGTVGVSYAQTLAAKGGASPYRWSVTTGALPPGLILVASAGVISGTPTSNGTANFTVTVTDGLGITATQALSITINVAPATPLPINQGDVGIPYTHYLAIGAPDNRYTWAITAGTLPPGIALDFPTSTITGTPTTAGTYTFTAEATGLSTGPLDIPLTLTINAAPAITSPTLPAATVGANYVQRMGASGGTTPYTWALGYASAPLPDGLSLDQFGLIVGTPTTAGTYSFTVNMTDPAGAKLTQTVTLVVNPAPTPTK